MNYRIVYLLKGESKRYVERLIKNVAKRFNVNFVYSGKQPAHITLKYRFETKRLKKLKRSLMSFVKKLNYLILKLEGWEILRNTH